MLRKHAPAAEDAHVRNLPSGVEPDDRGCVGDVRREQSPNPGAIGDNVDPEAPQRVGRPYA